MSKLIASHSTNCKPLTYLKTDTSKLATGGYLDKYDKDGDRNIVAFYSTKRSDIQNKSPTQSCMREPVSKAGAIVHFAHYLSKLGYDTYNLYRIVIGTISIQEIYTNRSTNVKHEFDIA